LTDLFDANQGGIGNNDKNKDKIELLYSIYLVILFYGLLRRRATQFCVGFNANIYLNLNGRKAK